MTGEKKSPETSVKANARRGARLLSKSAKITSSTISSPPKAAIAGSNDKKDEVHRRRNPLNEILRRRSADVTEDAQNASSAVEVVHVEQGPEEDRVGTRVNEADRIAELERALIIAKSDFESMRNDLQMAIEGHESDEAVIQQLRQELSQEFKGKNNEPSKPSTSPEVDHIDTFHEARAAQEVDLVEQNYELRYQIAKLQDHLTSEEALHREALQQASSHSEVEWNALRARLHATEKESQGRQQQLLALKSSISSMTRSDAQVTDSELVVEFTELSNRVREWVVSNYRRSKLHITNLSPETEQALALVSSKWWSVSNADRLSFFQAVVSSILVQILLQPVGVGLPETGPLSGIRSFAREARRTTNVSEYHEWERATLRMLESDQASSTFKDTQKQNLDELSRKVEHVLFDFTKDTMSSNARSSLRHILQSTANLQRTLLLQKARYNIIMYHDDVPTKPTFDERTMERIDDNSMEDDEDVDMDRRFAFCVFPSLQKYGDEQGETDLKNVLLKAKVCCGTT